METHYTENLKNIFSHYAEVGIFGGFKRAYPGGGIFQISKFKPIPYLDNQKGWGDENSHN